MRVETWYDVRCDNCSRRLVDFGFGMSSSIKRAKESAKEAGFQDIKIYSKIRTWCPICRKELENEANNE